MSFDPTKKTEDAIKALYRVPCQVMVTPTKAIYKIVLKIRKIRDVVKKVVDTIVSIRWLKIADLLLSELVAVASAIASQIISSIIEGVSEAIAGALKALLGGLIKLLMMGPESVLGLLSIPYNKAHKATTMEKMHLSNALDSYGELARIINKWKQRLKDATKIGGIGVGERLNIAISELDEALLSLEKVVTISIEDDTNPGSGNYVYSENAYAQFNAHLDKAIEATSVSPRIGILGALTESFEESYDDVVNNLYEARKKEIDAKYEKIRNDAYLEYYINNGDKNIDFSKDYEHQNFDSEGSAIGNAFIDGLNKVAEEGADFIGNLEMSARLKKYQAKLSNIQREYDYEIAKAHLSSTQDALKSKKISADAFTKMYGSSFTELQKEFVIDSERISNYGKSFFDSVNAANDFYIESKQYCTSMYRFKEIILGITETLMMVLRATSNTTGAGSTEALAEIYIEIAAIRNLMTSTLDQYNKENGLDENMSETTTVSKIVLYNTMLKSSEAVLNMMCMEELGKIINIDDYFKDTFDSVEELLTKIQNIPDWDGAKASWGCGTMSTIATSLARTDVKSPYAGLKLASAAMGGDKNLLSDTAKSISRHLPGKMSGSIKPLTAVNISKLGVYVASQRKIESALEKLINHNSLVMEALNSFEPSTSDAAEEYAAGLATLGVASAIFLGMNFADIILNVTGKLQKFADMFHKPDLPTVVNCVKMFPDMVDDLNEEELADYIGWFMRERKKDLKNVNGDEDALDATPAQDTVKNEMEVAKAIKESVNAKVGDPEKLERVYSVEDSEKYNRASSGATGMR